MKKREEIILKLRCIILENVSMKITQRRVTKTNANKR